MTTFTIILTLLIICLIGYWSLRQIYARQKNSLEFAIEFKNRFVTLANKYFKSYDSWSREGEVDYEQYTWLTKNVDQMQYDLGRIGIIDYVAPFTRYHIPRYQVLVNTLPKFRERLQNVEVNIADDCLARHIGISESNLKKSKEQLQNPIYWFKNGIDVIVLLPIKILNWFGLLNNKSLKKVIGNSVYQVFTGIIALITLISGIVTIIQGKEETLKFVRNILEK